MLGPIPDFELIKKIGGGSYGDVWLGRSITGVFRAVKIVDRNRFPDARPFLREFEGVKRFHKMVGDQPRQLALLHVGLNEAQGILYYIMELADDVNVTAEFDATTYVPFTLKEKIRQKKALSPIECSRIGAELAEALSGLHKAGLIHRDIKPSNIIFVSGVAKLADIGLITSTEQTITSVGTPGYSPPEGAGTPKADIFSLGIMLYEMCTGLPPAEFPLIPIHLLTHEESAAVLELNEVILRACDANPVKRHGSAQKMLDELRLILAGRSVQELNKMRHRVRLMARAATAGGLIAVCVVAGLAANNYVTLRAFAKQESAFRRQAEDNEALAVYTSNLAQAGAALARGDSGAARATLRRLIPDLGAPDLRGLEWRLLWNETNGSSTSTLGTVGDPPVTQIALSPDGRMLAVIERSDPNCAAVWDLTNNTRRLVARGCYSLGGFVGDNRHLLVGGYEGEFSILDLQDSTKNRRLNLKGRFVEQMAADGNMLFFGDGIKETDIIIWDVAADTESYRWDATANVPVGIPTCTLNIATRSHHGDKIVAGVSWSEDVEQKGALVIHRTRFPGKDIFLPGYARVDQLCLSRDERHLAIGTGTAIVLIDADTGRVETELKGHGMQKGMSFSPDGRFLAVAGEDQTLSVWDLAKAARIQYRGHEATILALTWADVGSVIITAGQEGSIRFWTQTQSPGPSYISQLWTGTGGDIAVDPSGDTVAGSNALGHLSLFDCTDLRKGRTVEGAFQPFGYLNNGTRLALLTRNEELVYLDVKSGTLVKSALRLESGNDKTAWAVSGNKYYAAFGYIDGTVVCWDLLNSKIVGRVASGAEIVSAVAITNDGKTLAVSDHQGILRIGRVDGIQPMGILPQKHDLVMGLDFSPSGDLLAVGNDRGQLNLWDVSRASLLSSAFGHQGNIYCVLFSSQSERIFTGGADGLIVSWSIDHLRLMAAWLAVPDPAERHGVCRLVLNTKGNRLAAITMQGELRVWDCN